MRKPQALVWFSLVLGVTGVAGVLGLIAPYTVYGQERLALTVDGALTPSVLETSLGRAWSIAGLSDAAVLVGTAQPVEGECLADNRYQDCLGPLFDHSGRWIQGALVAEGRALVRVTPLLPNDYLDALLDQERAARLARVGRWRRDWPTAIDALSIGEETVVLGEVRSVRPGRFTSYLTLVDGSGSMTAALDRSAREAIESAGAKLPDWKGRVILLRGWVGEDRFENDGSRPRIDVTQFRQIEFLD